MRGVHTMPEHVTRQVEHYAPILLPEEVWSEWRESILGVVYTVRPDRVEDSRRIMSILARFVVDLIAWGMEPPITDHLILGRIERHIAEIKRPGSRRTRRTELIKLGRIFNPAHRWPQASPKIARSTRLPPYSSAEGRSLMRGAEHYFSTVDRQLFQVALALGLNGHCGRSAPGILRERVFVRDGYVVIGGDELRPDMAVRGQLAVWLVRWHERTKPEHPIIGPHQRFNSRLSLLRGDDGKTRVQMARLRTTFITRLLLEPGLLQGEILQLAGLRSTSSLDEYRQYVPETPPELVAAKYEQVSALPTGWEI